MDLIDCLLGDHRRLRDASAAMADVLGDPCELGWDDCHPLENAVLLQKVRRLTAAFEKHEALEERFLSPLLRQLQAHADMAGVIAQGHDELEQTMRLLDVVVAICDGKHVYRVRAMAIRLREEIERHFDYEEKRVFPKLRERLPAGLLNELGRRAILEAQLEQGRGREHRRQAQAPQRAVGQVAAALPAPERPGR